jgi:hypothetical protein
MEASIFNILLFVQEGLSSLFHGAKFGISMGGVSDNDHRPLILPASAAGLNARAILVRRSGFLLFITRKRVDG